MLKTSVLAVAALALGLLLTGCGAQPGKNIVKYNKGMNLPNVTEAPRDGMYALYSTWDTTAITSYSLHKGDRLGFEEGDQPNTVVAVAGNNRYPVRTTAMTGSYYWKAQK